MLEVAKLMTKQSLFQLVRLIIVRNEIFNVYYLSIILESLIRFQFFIYNMLFRERFILFLAHSNKNII